MKKLIILSFTILILSISSIAQDDIRKVDFQNFTYSPDYCKTENRSNITVKDGRFSEAKEVEGYTERIYFNIYGLTFGDLDGDKKDEAVIFSGCNSGGTGTFTEAYIYKMVNKKPKRIMLLSGGDRAYGGLREARIENGLLIVESNDAGENGGACCPEFIVTNTYRLDGSKLKEVGKATRREIYPQIPIIFDKGTYGKTFSVKMPAGSDLKLYSVEARKGQILVVSKTSKQAEVSLWKGEADILTSKDTLIATLKDTGKYVFDLNNFSDKDLEFDVTVTITDPPRENADIESIYTDLDAKKCKTIELDEGGAGFYRGECEGVGNYKLEVIESDIRQTINVIQKQSGDKWELDFMRNVSIGFSSVGAKAEWRVKKINGNIYPIALIVRYNVSEPTEDGNHKNRSSLVVTKFDGEFVCITDIVPPMLKQNERARELADVAATKPCIQQR